LQHERRCTVVQAVCMLLADSSCQTTSAKNTTHRQKTISSRELHHVCIHASKQTIIPTGTRTNSSILYTYLSCAVAQPSYAMTLNSPLPHQLPQIHKKQQGMTLASQAPKHSTAASLLTLSKPLLQAWSTALEVLPLK
jgi:outer membrane biogenesis lipoprotein LolB